MYYLFIRKDEDIKNYMAGFELAKENRQKGISPVVSETRLAKTNLAESLPYNVLNGLLLVLGTLVLNSVQISEIFKVSIVLVVNNFFGAVSNFIFVNVKHRLRVRLCRRLGIPDSEENIAIMESLEYQSL